MSVMAAQVLWGLVLAVSLALSFLYSGLETGIYAMNKIRLELRADSAWPTARLLHRYLRDFRNFLAVLLIGNNVANYAATTALTALFVLAGESQNAGWYTQAVATPVLFVFCESLPKNLFQRLSETLVYRFVWLLHGSSVVFNALGIVPLVRGVSSMLLRLTGAHDQMARSLAISPGERILIEGRASGVLTHFQTVMADRVMHIRSVHLRDVMIPMDRVRWMADSASRQDLMDQLRQHNFSRLPLREPSGQVVGIADVYDLLLGTQEGLLSASSAKPLVLSQKQGVTDSLYQMQRLHEQMAVVADEAGRHVGIVTIKDLVEEIVGDLEAW